MGASARRACWVKSGVGGATDLTGEESSGTEGAGWGLEGAENIGQEGEHCGEGLGEVGLRGTNKRRVRTAGAACWLGDVILTLQYGKGSLTPPI